MHPKLEMMGASPAPAAPGKGRLANVDQLAAGIQSKGDATRLLKAAAVDLATARKAIETSNIPYAAFSYVDNVRDWTKKAAAKLEKDGLTPDTKRYVASASLQSAKAYKTLGKMAKDPGLGDEIIAAAQSILRKTGQVIADVGEPIWKSPVAIGAAAIGLVVLLTKD